MTKGNVASYSGVSEPGMQESPFRLPDLGFKAILPKNSQVEITLKSIAHTATAGGGVSDEWSFGWLINASATTLAATISAGETEQFDLSLYTSSKTPGGCNSGQAANLTLVSTAEGGNNVGLFMGQDDVTVKAPGVWGFDYTVPVDAGSRKSELRFRGEVRANCVL
ncbi:MAG: hypothetical protein V3T84_05200 [Phycisphaerales bacterium]